MNFLNVLGLFESDKVVNDETGNFWFEKDGVICLPFAFNAIIVAIKGKNFLGLKQWSAELIRNEAQCRTWKTPNANIGELVIEKFRKSDFEKMGIFFMVIMSTPLDMCLPLVTFRYDKKYTNLYYDDSTDAGLTAIAHDGAFAFTL